MNKPVCISNGLQPVEEFLASIIRRLLDLGYKAPNAKTLLEWDSDSGEYSATFEINFLKPTKLDITTIDTPGATHMLMSAAIVNGDDIQIQATHTTMSKDPDEALKALMRDALKWIDAKEKA